MEKEPNNTSITANYLPMDSTMSGSSCNDTDYDYFMIITPFDGMLRVFTNVSVSDTSDPQKFNITLYSHDQNTITIFHPTTGKNGFAVSDSFSKCCIAADTFYLEINRNWAYTLCYNYTFSFTVIPASYSDDYEPNQFPWPSLSMPYNTIVEGHLGFSTEPTYEDSNDYYILLPPSDGTLKTNISVEAQSSGSGKMAIIPYNKFNYLFADIQYAAVGPFQSPKDTDLYWSCFGNDTFYLNPSIINKEDGGYSYRISYTLIKPVFNNDIEPNNSFLQAQLVNPNDNIEGHEYFNDDDSYDYFKFYKDDTGYLKLYVWAETSENTAIGACNVQIFDYVKNGSYPLYATIGTNSTPVLDSVYFYSLGQDTFYIVVYNNNPSAGCMSYRIQLRSKSITGINQIAYQPQLNIYPNPSLDDFTIDLRRFKNARIRVYDVLGQELEYMLQNNDNKLTFGKEFAAGIYLIKISDGATDQIESKLIKIE